MKRFFIVGALLALMSVRANAEVDPNFHIYLCFGQSNMEGNAQWESIDNQYVDPRFQMLATTSFDSPKRTMGNWYTAYCPIVSPMGKLGVTDYFGRTMVAAMPADVKIGVVAVAMGGAPIEMFDKDKYQSKIAEDPSAWHVTLANWYYGGNPYGRLIEMAKIAQQSGVIKGILLHQGESNNTQQDWPQKVKKIYNDILTDLGLNAEDVPLFAGETEYQEEGGACWGHNAVIAKLPQVIPTAHVVSAKGCPGNGQDAFHFSPTGYRMLGKRYAYETLKVMGRETRVDAEYTLPENLKKFLTATGLEEVSDIVIRKGSSRSIAIKAVFADGHKEDVSSEVQFSVKMRLGQDDMSEAFALMPIINAMPLTQVTLHPRLGRQQYKGSTDREAFGRMLEECRHPVVYNGDITELGQVDDLFSQFDTLKGVMLGRGLLARPWLFTDKEPWAAVREMHSKMYDHACRTLQGDSQILARLHAFWEYQDVLPDKKQYKAIMKSGSLRKYDEAVASLSR